MLSVCGPGSYPLISCSLLWAIYMLIYMLLACRHTHSAHGYVIILFYFFTEKIKFFNFFFSVVESMDLSLCECPVALAVNRPTPSRDLIVSCV